MIAIEGESILTAAEMRAAEEVVIATGVSVETLMERAGTAIAHAVRRLSEANEILILCGPGNNGGDGYVAARVLAEMGAMVRVAALSEPKTDAARAARAAWRGPVERLGEAEPAPVLVDALFGTGLTRPLDATEAPSRASNPDCSPADAGAQLSFNGAPDGLSCSPASAGEQPVVECLRLLATAAQLTIAVDLPSGLATDSGRVLSTPPVFTLTLALCAVKPAHLLQPAARYCGQIRLLDIGVTATSQAEVLPTPILPTPGPDSHKYTRGMVAIIAGTMSGAADLAALAAMRAGAGYVTLVGDSQGPPHALVRTPFSTDALANDRIGALVIGPGLGRDDTGRTRLDAALSAGHPLIIDGDALRLIDPDRIKALNVPVILTPHAGEFDALFGKSDADKITRARDAATRANAVVVFKGADTVIAAPDGRVRIAQGASDWLSTAGTGDVLAGAIGAMLAMGLAAGLDPLDAAGAGVWLHGDAARRLGAAFIADDLADALRCARAAL
ncbi:carbohydrate kinase [Sphingomonas sp. Leaf34]|uniref:bifunctional ADP-dependent NAD(P)H-hydrate dehydratase/NAD(P)H-hydrate epimerase n=1 Tax=Sphingomonas sp. Leaf34 TaxID=1736216 RepID=UPI0006F5145D|nr:bifunctional ADP-dependent NAD(P)H-hydrate dehydratase/NAD(P)H-hydrate epimerase [Sphingomonas sp. Leaf34]KQN27150.1 carbohydrate kinase [Sphingomonas sp. Leaf34]